MTYRVLGKKTCHRQKVPPHRKFEITSEVTHTSRVDRSRVILSVRVPTRESAQNHEKTNIQRMKTHVRAWGDSTFRSMRDLQRRQTQTKVGHSVDEVTAVASGPISTTLTTPNPLHRRDSDWSKRIRIEREKLRGDHELGIYELERKTLRSKLFPSSRTEHPT